ncbi:MAG: hypothetical protein WC682_05420 [Parcubacteria group bacterium]|jgi:hypothetical protein
MGKKILFIIPILLLILLAGCSYRINNSEQNKTSFNDSKQSTLITVKDNQTVVLSSEWDELIKNLYVPSMYSDLCGYGEGGKCPAFSFVDGELPEKLKNNLNGEKGGNGNADMGLVINKAIIGAFDIDNKKIDVVAIPYWWSWASSGSGIYIVKENNKRAEVVARISFLKPVNLEILEIKDNKIKIAYTDPSDNKNYSQTCFFTQNQLSEKFLQCNVDK